MWRRRYWWLLAAVGASALAVFVACPSPIDPVAYRPAKPQPLDGPLAPNEALAAVERLATGQLAGPEDVEPADGGALLTGNADGSIRRLVSTGSSWTVEAFAHTGGRPLGLDRDRDGTLWVADAQRGLLAIDPAGEVRLVLAEAAGAPISFADDVATGPEGTIYVSDASSLHGPEALFLETLEARPRGRLIEHDPSAGRTRVLVDDLYFANGVAVAADGSFVLVAETFRYRVRRHWLIGPRAGETEIFVDRLPGFPDGVSSGRDGGFWLALYSPRSALLDGVLHPRPWLKRLVARLPQAVQPPPRAYGLVVELDRDGRIVSSLHDPEGLRFPFVTSVEAFEGALYLGSIESDAIGRYRLD